MPFQFNPYLALMVFIAISVLYGGVMAGMGGWRILAERYPMPVAPPMDEECFRFASMRTAWGLFGTAAYQGCVEIGVGSRGISLALWAPFRLFHPPMFIPWEDVEKCRISEWFRGTQLMQITVRDGVELSVTGRAAPVLFRYASERSLTGDASQRRRASDSPDRRTALRWR
jgi:hypothetical protein